MTSSTRPGTPEKSSTENLADAVSRATGIAQGIGALSDHREIDDQLAELSEFTRRHPGQGALISCQVFALYQATTVAQAAHDWPRAGDMLTRLATVLANIPDGQDVTAGSTGDGRTLTGRNLMMTALLAQISGTVPGITDAAGAMAWLEAPHPALQGAEPLDRVKQFRMADVLDLVAAAADEGA